MQTDEDFPTPLSSFFPSQWLHLTIVKRIIITSKEAEPNHAKEMIRKVKAPSAWKTHIKISETTLAQSLGQTPQKLWASEYSLMWQLQTIKLIRR